VIGHAIVALLVTILMALGLLGLGALCGGSRLLSRWVRGWTVLWWVTALLSMVAGPSWAALGSGAALIASAIWFALRELKSPREAIIAAVAILCGAPLFLAPPTFYDTLVYHLGLPWTWLVNDAFAPISHHVFSFFPIATQTVYLIPVSLNLPEVAAGLHWCCLVIGMIGMRRIARQLGANRWDWLAPALLAACWQILWVAGQAAADLLVMTCFVAAIDALVSRGEDHWWWLDLGLACGLAAATKFPAGVPIAAVLGVAFVLARHDRLLVVRSGFVAATTASLVLIRNWIHTGNPFYPLLWNLLGGKGWTLRDQERWQALVYEGVGGLESIPNGLLRLIRPPGGLGWWALTALPLMILALGGRDDAGRNRRLVAAITLAALCGWLASSQTTRYAFPLAALLAILAACGISRLSGRTATVVGGLMGITILHGALGFVGFTLGTLHLGDLWLGRRTAEQWRASVTINDPLPLYRAAHDELPPSARILVVGEGRSWGCSFSHHVSSPYDLQLVQEIVENSRDPADVARRISDAGWTHLVINWGELERLGGPSFQVLRWTNPADHLRWNTFLRDMTVHVKSRGNVELRALDIGFVDP